MLSTATSGGSSRKATSVCQRSVLGALSGPSSIHSIGSSRPRAAVVRKTLGLPKIEAKAMCCASSRSWLRKKITRWRISASWISLRCTSSSGLRRSTPPTTAPIIGVTGETEIVRYRGALARSAIRACSALPEAAAQQRRELERAVALYRVPGARDRLDAHAGLAAPQLVDVGVGDDAREGAAHEEQRHAQRGDVLPERGEVGQAAGE